MKKFAENKKNQTSFIQSQNKSQKSSPKAILITGGTDVSRVDRSQQVSKIMLPTASCKIFSHIFIYL